MKDLPSDEIYAKKALGQNFLTDSTIAHSMVENLNIQKGDKVIEIGSGMGAVTQHLARVCKSQNAHLTAVEFDIDLIPILKSKITENANIKIENANILNFLDYYEVSENTPFKIIGSLPYNITSPLLHRLIKHFPMPELCIFLIQKEVAQKLCEKAPNSNYLSVFVQTFYTPSILKIVDKNLFDPVPQVDGAITKLIKKSFHPQISDISRYEKFLHHAFSHPRKMLNKVFSKEELEKYNLNGNARPQDYSDHEYLTAFLSRINA